MKITGKYLNKRVKFISGNFEGEYGFCTSVNEQDPEAMYGYSLTFKVGDKEVKAQKTDHFVLAPSCNANCDQGDYREGGKCDRNGCYQNKRIMEKEEYIPFGEGWKKEMMLWTKEDLAYVYGVSQDQLKKEMVSEIRDRLIQGVHNDVDEVLKSKINPHVDKN